MAGALATANGAPSSNCCKDNSDRPPPHRHVAVHAAHDPPSAPIGRLASPSTNTCPYHISREQHSTPNSAGTQDSSLFRTDYANVQYNTNDHYSHSHVRARSPTQHSFIPPHPQSPQPADHPSYSLCWRRPRRLLLHRHLLLRIKPALLDCRSYPPHVLLHILPI